MAQQVSLLKFFLLLALVGPLLYSSALVLPTHTTTTSTASSVSPDTDEPFTTKRNAVVYFDLPKVTPFPLPVVNKEIKSTVAETSTMTSAAKTTSAKVSTTTSKLTIAPQRGSTEQPLYRLNGSNGKACILLQVDALITIKYKTTLGVDEEADIYVPNDATVTGSCDNDNFVIMSLKWDAFVLSWNFAKTPGNERWYVEKIDLTYNSSDRHFEHIDQPNRTIRLSSTQKHSSSLFSTPVGKSYACNEELEISLTDNKNFASVLLRDMKLQPFKFKSNDFATFVSCTDLSARAARDETAPVAVGSTLAAAVLLTITGYAGWRYFKVKKVKYDTME